METPPEKRMPGRRMIRGIVCVVAMLVASPVLADSPGGHEANASATADMPEGSPYHVGDVGRQGADYSQVPLRDYLSSRIDQLRGDILDRIVQSEKQQREIIDERDKQYAQRFAAQQEALTAALQAAKEAVANALSAAKEAVTKAEDASNKRFDSVNEFRKTLTDQTSTFVSKDTFEARTGSLEEKVSSLTNRLDSMKSSSEGASNLWLIIAGVIGVGAMLFSAFINFTRNHAKAQ